jgi:hypothetical protein
MITRYACQFENGDGEDCAIIVELSAHEIKIAHSYDDPEIMAEAFALFHAYKLAPEGFRHRAGGVVCVN